MRAAVSAAVLVLMGACTDPATLSQQPQGVGFATSAAALDRSEASWVAQNQPRPPAQSVTAPQAAAEPKATAPQITSAPQARPEPPQAAIATAASTTATPEASAQSSGGRFSLFGKKKPTPELAPVVAAAPAPEDDIAAATVAALAAAPASASTPAPVAAPAADAAAPATPLATSPKGPSVVDYALATTHAPGDRLYVRSGGAGGDCAAYGSPDFAQLDFLKRGGPEADPLGLDPDGDGFACTWSPVRLRAALGGAGQG